MSEQQYHPVDNSGMAIVGLIAGIAGWTVVPFLGAIAAVITGHMAKREIRESMGRLGGDGLATAGLVLGYASLGLFFVGLCITVAALVFGIGLPLCTLGASGFGLWLAPFLGL